MIFGLPEAFLQEWFNLSGIVAEKTDICKFSGIRMRFHRQFLRTLSTRCHPLHRRPSFERFERRAHSLALNRKYDQESPNHDMWLSLVNFATWRFLSVPPIHFSNKISVY